MKRVRFGVVLCALAGVCWGQHSDILIGVTDNVLETYAPGDPNGPARVFGGALGELGIPGFTDDPGYNSGALAPNARLGYGVPGPLWFWDGADYVAPPGNERLDILLSGVLLTSVDGASGSQDGPYFTQASGSGGVHRHLQYWVRDPNFSDADPFDNPISPGAYALTLTLTSDVHTASEPFAIVFNNGLDPNGFAQAQVAALDLLGGEPCRGDVDGSGTIDIDDLLVVLGAFGTTFDIDDLLDVLGAFGSDC